jgi:hypothetical protein
VTFNASGSSVNLQTWPLASSLLCLGLVNAAAHMQHPELPHVFVAGPERGLKLLRRALQIIPSIFVSHLPIEGEGCVETLKRQHKLVMWLSPWAVSHASFIASKLDACFVFIDGEDGRVVSPAGCRCLHLSEAGLAAEPEVEVQRLVEFLHGHELSVS